MPGECTRSAAGRRPSAPEGGQGGAPTRRRRRVRSLHTALTRSGYRARVPISPKEVLVRFVVRLLVLACVAASPGGTGRIRSRPHVGGLPRRPRAPLRRRPDRGDGPGTRQRSNRRADAHRLDEGRPDPADGRHRSVRSRIPFRRRRRGRQERAAARPRGDDHAVGDAVVGQRRSEAAGDAQQHRGLPELRARRRIALLGPVRRGTRSSASTRSGTSRTSRRSWFRSSMQEVVSSAPRTTRSWRGPGSPASRPATAARSSRSGRRRRMAATSTVTGSPTPSPRRRS